VVAHKKHRAVHSFFHLLAVALQISIARYFGEDIGELAQNVGFLCPFRPELGPSALSGHFAQLDFIELQVVLHSVDHLDHHEAICESAART